MQGHHEVVTPIAAEDPARAQQSVRQHSSDTLVDLIEIRARHPEYLFNSPLVIAA